ncbi:MAG: hypothetical protein MI919_21340, partial [Holophagales bacterium]|nr:hypothetical protein [Holophagales bacterium]
MSSMPMKPHPNPHARFVQSPPSPLAPAVHRVILLFALLGTACGQGAPDETAEGEDGSGASPPAATTSPAPAGGEETIVLSAFLSEEDLAAEATPEGRLVIGRGEDYEPSTEDPGALFARLKGSMKERRELAWEIVEAMLRPIELDLPEGKVHVPLWHTWYESGMGGNPEVPRMMELYFEKRKARPDEDVKVLIDEVFKEFADKDFADELTDA